jgi:hypothetical protein
MGVNNRMSKQRLKPFKEFLPERLRGTRQGRALGALSEETLEGTITGAYTLMVLPLATGFYFELFSLGLQNSQKAGARERGSKKNAEGAGTPPAKSSNCLGWATGATSAATGVFRTVFRF